MGTKGNHRWLPLQQFTQLLRFAPCRMMVLIWRWMRFAYPSYLTRHSNESRNPLLVTLPVIPAKAGIQMRFVGCSVLTTPFFFRRLRIWCGEDTTPYQTRNLLFHWKIYFVCYFSGSLGLKITNSCQ